MPFIISEQFPKKMACIKEKYEAEKHITLEQSTAPYAISVFFGAPNIDARKKQLLFIDQWLCGLRAHLSPQEPDGALHPAKTRIIAFQVLMSVCFYIKSNINKDYSVMSSKKATLGKLIDEAMDLSSTNPLDKETKAACLIATKKYLRSTDRHDLINQTLEQAKKPLLSTTEWRDFKRFIKNECLALKEEDIKQYPFTTVLVPVFQQSGKIIGWSLGYLIGQSIAKSTSLDPIRKSLILFVAGTGGFLMGGPPGSTAAALMLVVAPEVARALLTTVCSVTSAYALGEVLGVMGYITGHILGGSLDLSFNAIYHLFTYLLNRYPSHKPKNTLEGIELIHGHRVSKTESSEPKIEELDSRLPKLIEDYQAEEEKPLLLMN